MVDGQEGQGSDFGERERQILEFERFWWKYAGAKERAIKETLDMSATRYYQLLNRAFRQRERVARRLGAQHS